MPEDKVPNPRLQFRLPREDNALVVPFDDKPPLMDTAKVILGERMQETRMGYRLDGKLCNVKDILKAAGLRFADGS
jgi:hypothetical protein